MAVLAVAAEFVLPWHLWGFVDAVAFVMQYSSWLWLLHWCMWCSSNRRSGSCSSYPSEGASRNTTVPERGVAFERWEVHSQDGVEE